ncbi:MAG: Glu/Leu/Phe/Val dehydrogenase dimerization domain-containing protein [Blastomonas sp.]
MSRMEPMELPHEAVHLFEDARTGLRAVIAIHSTALGPAAGGCRVWHYAADSAATGDALRLSEGMTYKNAMAGLPLGGGKAVIMLPADFDGDRRALFKAFGRCVESLQGRYVTAEDVGSTVEDMLSVAAATDHVAGLPQTRSGQAGGDPSPHTAQGVFLAMQVAAERKFGTPLKDTVVGVQGLGNVGMALAAKLSHAGAKLLVSDMNERRVAQAVHMFGAQQVAPEKIVGAPMDILAPCAMGAIVNHATIGSIQARIICGAANNQLETPARGAELARRGIFYAPDYLVNAGGIISVCAEYLGESLESVERRVAEIGPRLGRMIDEAERSGEAMNLVADRHARQIVADGRARRKAA